MLDGTKYFGKLIKDFHYCTTPEKPLAASRRRF
jgi:hypothetical protein